MSRREYILRAILSGITCLIPWKKKKTAIYGYTGKEKAIELSDDVWLKEVRPIEDQPMVYATRTDTMG